MRGTISITAKSIAIVSWSLALTAANDFSTSSPSAAPLQNAIANDNERAAGKYHGDTLVLRLTLATVNWHLLGEKNPALTVAAFAEEGRTPSIPGPLLRVRSGTPIHATIRNSFNDTLIVRGLSERSALDSVVILPNGTRDVTVFRKRPGTYQYWGTLAEWQRNVPLPPVARRHGLLRPRFDSQLAGALVVDGPGRIQKDRIFVITMTVDQKPPIHFDHRGMPGREFTAINGRSWPYTERLHYMVGDTIHWRIVNAAVQTHPMHLHGFYFRVDSYASAETGIDSIYPAAERRMAVTQTIRVGESTDITWSPDRPGNWLFHCHLASHVTKVPPIEDSTVIEYPSTHDHGDPDQHAMTGMNGLVLGITVGGTAKPAAKWHPMKRLKLFVQSDSAQGDSARRFGYVLQQGAEPRPDSIESPGPLLLLTRGEPTSVEVINRLNEPTSVHWHGIELESYYDGIAGWSGKPGSIEPAIRAGSSFDVHITPKRAGTFMYHTHFNDMNQQYGGLVGPLVVLEPGQHWDASREILMMVSDGPHATLRINGSATPAARDLHAGTTYRIRAADIAIYRNALVVRVVRDSSLVTWRSVAKDGFTLPPRQATIGSSTSRLASGETADFELTPETPGELTLEIGSPNRDGVFQRQGALHLHVVAPVTGTRGMTN